MPMTDQLGLDGLGGSSVRVSAMTPTQRVQRILDEATGRDLSSWERFDFLPSIRQRSTLTEKQEKVLAGIERRLFGESGDD